MLPEDLDFVVCPVGVDTYQVLGSRHQSLTVVEDLLTFEQLLVTEVRSLAVGLLDPAISLVTMILLVNDLVTVDVAAAEGEVGLGVRTDLVDADPLLTEVSRVAVTLLVTVVGPVTVLMLVDVALPETVGLLDTGLGTVDVFESDVIAEVFVFEDCADTIS